MKKELFLLCALCFCTLTSFSDNNACDYAGSNIEYVKSQTRRALDAEDLNSSRFYAYRALNAIEKSRKQFEACGCDYMSKSIFEGLDNLKKATRVASLNGTKILLKKALENEIGSLEALEEHDELHNSKYSSDVLAMNTVESEKKKKWLRQPQGKALEQKIDSALIAFRKSLDEVINFVDCKEAYAFADKVYRHCELQLLNQELSEAKKYYNLKTKEIAADALNKLEMCQ